MVMASLHPDQPAPAALHSNWVVQKFGGTSVGKFALNIIQQVVEYVDTPPCTAS
jgi:aspartate kinase